MIATINRMRKIFDYGSVCVTGQRGRGKDMLMANIACRSRGYISNIDYGGNFVELDFNKLDVLNSYSDLVSGDITPYRYPYPEGYDIYISDIGVYFPAQYCLELNRKYPRLPIFLGLSRQLALANVHLNTQSLSRCWDKYKEQSDCYVLCRSVNKFALKLGLVIQRVTVYDNLESCQKRAIPFSLPKPSIFASKETRLNYEIEKQRYLQTYGEVKNFTLIYRNKSTYDTRYFKRLLENGLSET